MKISVIGTGYVGLVTGTCFADMGITVTCVDKNKEKIDSLKKGILPIYEPGLSELVVKNVEHNRLFFTTSLEESINLIDLLIIAVGTPPGDDGSADLSQVLSVAKEIGMCMNHYFVIVTKSTVPVGTNNKIRKVIQAELDKREVNIKFDIASNPEFLKEGDAINDFMRPDRVIVGVDSDKAKHTLERLYHSFSLNNTSIIFMDIISAEMTKYASNSMLATRISFMNEIANLCETVGANISEVKRGMGADSRIGNKFLNAGCGYGGSCFPKDVKALINTGFKNGHNMDLLTSVENVNAKQKGVIFNKIYKHFNSNLKDKRFGIWGVSFKPGTDDMREAPSLVIINKLLEAGAKVRIYDPEAMNVAENIFGNKIEYATDMYDALTDANALVVVTEWLEFKIPKFSYIEKALKDKIIFDGRNIYEPKQIRDFGYIYYGIGR